MLRTVAQPEAEPVQVLISSAPLSRTSLAAMTFPASVRTPISMT
jgi:hypothetical protein